MIDVHAPHEGIHNVRQFLLHLLTITIGLLIALGLEGCVEWVHHRNLQREADANLRQELRDNRRELASTRAAISGERQNLVSILKFVDARSQKQPYDVHRLSLNYVLATVRDASWRTASATGALSYMDYDHVKQYADAYQLQDEYSRLQRLTLDDFLELQSYFVYGFDPEKMPPATAEAASVDVRRTLAHLQTMDQFALGLSQSYDHALASE